MDILELRQFHESYWSQRHSRDRTASAAVEDDDGHDDDEEEENSWNQYFQRAEQRTRSIA